MIQMPYILHATLITTICFLFYKLLLQKETFYRLNRWTLMGCLAVSFGLPLLPVPREWSWQGKWVEKAFSPEQVSRDSREGKSLLPVETAQPELAATDGDSHQRVVIPAGAAKVKKESGATHKTAVTVTVKAKGSAAGGTAPPARASETLPLPLQMVSGASTSVPESNALAGGQDGKPITGAARTATGTPVGKDNAGTPVPLFSGAMLLLVVQWVFYCYLFGVVLFGANFLLQLAVLLYQSYARPVIRDGRFRIVEISGNRAPCSFGNTIFINPENYDWETYNQILIHEKIHVSGRHTLDILLAEMALVIQWFNPFAWLYRREVENNLEFLTDANVLLHQEVERSAYQLSLLRVSAPHLPFSLTNNYNQSLLKRRIVMMNSKRSSLHTVWKYFFLIPILTGLVCTLNKPAAFGAGNNKKSGPEPGTGSAKPVNPLKLSALWATIADTAKRPAKARKDTTTDGDATTTYSTTESYSTGDGHGSTSTYSADAYTYSLDAAAAKADAAVARADAADPSYQIAGTAMAPVAVSLQNEARVNAMQIDLQNKALQTQQTLAYTQTLTMQQPTVNVVTSLGKIDLNVNVTNLHINDTDLQDGSWFATTSDNRLSFELKVETDERSWSNTLRVDKSEITPFPGQGNVEFKLVREAGTMTFKGQFDGQEGFGHFHFTPDAAYYSALRQMGVEDLEDRRQFGFFSLNIKKDYVNMVMHNGYPHISQRDLISFAAMHIDQEFIQYWHGAGLTDAEEPRNLISLKALKIDRAYVDDLKAAGYDHLDMRELQSLRAQHIDRAYIRSIGRGRDNEAIPVRELVTYKAMHIDSAYMDELKKAGYDNLTTREITSLYSMHVTPVYIKELRDLGYKDIPVRDLTNLMAMHITPEYIKGFQAIGYKDLESRQLSSLKSMGVTPEFVKGFTDLGYSDLSANNLNSLKAMGITPEFVKGFKDIGFDHIPVNLLTSLKATGVNAEYVSKMKARGFESKDLNKYIRLKNDFN